MTWRVCITDLFDSLFPEALGALYLLGAYLRAVRVNGQLRGERRPKLLRGPVRGLALRAVSFLH